MDEKPNLIVLEQQQRLSSSIVWKLQRRFFEQQGIDAWRKGVVPHYITSNAFIANAYAKVVIGYLRDCQAANRPLDSKQPVYLVELGSGSGRFAFHFLKKFLHLVSLSAFKDMRFVYVMTDFSPHIITFWGSHGALQSLVAAGQLDFAHFDAENPGDLTLLHGGQTLSASNMDNPMVLIANYVFDSIPQDSFSFQDGQILESLVTVSVPEDDPELARPDLLSRIELFNEHRLAKADYYDDPSLNEILAAYGRSLTDTTILFPNVALRCIQFFYDLANGRLLLLSGDKGYSKEEDLQNRSAPAIAVHGSFSLSVNYHAIGEYFRKLGGQMLEAPHRHYGLNVVACPLGQPPSEQPETALAYEEAIVQGGPDNFFSLKRGVEAHYQDLSLEQLLAFLRFSGWDSNVFLGSYPALLQKIEKATDLQCRNLYEVLGRVWETYFPIGDERDLPTYMGLLLSSIKYYPQALYFFRAAERLYGPERHTLFNLAQCYFSLNQLEEAQNYLTRTLELDPEFEAALDLQSRIQAEAG